MNKPHLILLLAALSLCTGCAAVPHGPRDSQPKLLQLNDENWVDLSDVREIQFQRTDPSNPNQAADPFNIVLWHKGPTDNVFTFSFGDQASAYAAWKRLVEHLHGSLHEEDWKITPAKMPAATQNPPTAAAPPPPANTDSPPFATFQRSLDELNACHDEKLITDAEYQRGRDADGADFATEMAQGQPYYPTFNQLHAQLWQLEKLKKTHVLSDDNIVTIRTGIMSRYGLAPKG